jgi:hypothetical protein
MVKSHTTDSAGNSWYLTDIRSGGCNLIEMLGKKTSFNMMEYNDKALAMTVCTPLSTVIGKVGSLFSNGKYYVTDKDGNELDSYNEIRNLLAKPNVLQNGTQFLKQIEMCLKLFGYCPISTLRATKKSLPSAMWIIRPELFHIVSTGKLFKQKRMEDIIERAYISWGAGEIDLEPEEYFIIYDLNADITGDKGDDIRFSSRTDSLSFPVSNWVAQMVASNTLIVHGGPKGIIYNNDTSEFGNASLTPQENEELNKKFKSKFGLVGKAWSILVSKAKLGWLPLDYDSGQLRLHEEDNRCSDKIANEIGVNPNIFRSDSKYENQESAERKAYHGVVIPDSLIVADVLTKNLCPDGCFIKIDFSHVECLQKNKKEEASALSLVSAALSKLVDGNLITVDEARGELVKYLDIDPDKVKGEYKTDSKTDSKENGKTE